jgi:hypothetical protein
MSNLQINYMPKCTCCGMYGGMKVVACYRVYGSRVRQELSHFK